MNDSNSFSKLMHTNTFKHLIVDKMGADGIRLDELGP